MTVFDLANHLGKVVPESAVAMGEQQNPRFAMAETERFAIALLRGGKGLSAGGWEMIKSQDTAPNQVITSGERSISVGGNVTSSTIIIGDNNVTETSSSYLRSLEVCRDRQTLNQYLDGILNCLKQHGCLDIQQSVTSGSQHFNYVAKISDFEFPLGPFSTRGEAIFLFSEFASITTPILQQFSSECLQWAREYVNHKAAGQAFYNFRVPTHLCFAIALVDQIDAETKVAIQTANPIDHRVDVLWYEVPVVFGLSDKELYFYNKPANFSDHFKGEMAWKHIRTVIRQLLSPTKEHR